MQFLQQPAHCTKITTISRSQSSPQQTSTMGCTPSKSSQQCVHHGGVVIDDSIHAMIAREKRHAKAHGDAPLVYRPRAPHPLLQQQQYRKASAVTITSKEEEEDAPTVVVSDDHSEHSDAVPAADDIERLLFHSRNHCDTVDVLDLPSRGRHLRVAAGAAVRSS